MKTNIALIIIFFSIIIHASVEFLTGVIESTKLNGEGCICHNITADSTVKVWVEGPDSLFTGATGSYKIYLTGGPSVFGGFNVASRFGSLDTADTNVIKLLGELTHKNPLAFVNDTVFWSFDYTAPDSVIVDTIYSVANSVNGDSIPTELDKWNFGENFPVKVIQRPSEIEEDITTPEIFVLEQNYPNPFNPSTIIEWQIKRSGFVSLKIFDSEGKETAVLIEGYKSEGKYLSVFNGKDFSSGVYYCRLIVDGRQLTRKMLLIK
ncbi:MAG: T9SS type A sorting domain-containing protein [Ignavibacteriaceae bacterium]|nr:T9SS type A sorting domain-containing protein [Ignavibacteriaceae bacterium]